MKLIDNFNRTVHINLSQIVRSYQILYDSLEPKEFSQRFKHEPQITLIVEVRAVHSDRFLVFNFANNVDLVKAWIDSIYRGNLDEIFTKIPKCFITNLDDPNIVRRKSIL